MALFGHKKEKTAVIDLRGNANEIFLSLSGVRRLIEGRNQEQAALLRQLETMASQYQNRVETSVDVGALDQISLDTLTFLDTLLRYSELTDPQQEAELIAFAVQVLEKVCRIQSQCKAKPDSHLVDCLTAGCNAVREKYNMLLGLQRYSQHEAKLSQSKADYEARIKALLKDGKECAGDARLIYLLKEQSTLGETMALLNQTLRLESTSIPMLTSVFEQADGLGISKELIAALAEANRAHAETVAREQEGFKMINDLHVEGDAISDVTLDKLATQQTQGERMLAQRLEKDIPALSQQEKTAPPQVESAPQHAAIQEEIL